MRQRLIATPIALASLVLLAVMPAWWRQPQGEAYALDPDQFAARTEAMVKAHASGRTTETGQPIVRPPEGDVYLMARRWSWYPVLELEAGRRYRLHVASQDVVHGFHLSVNDAERLLVPGRVEVVTVRAEKPGRFAIVCSDYCGLEHNGMQAPLLVVDRP